MAFSLGDSESDNESSDFETLGEKGNGSPYVSEEFDAAGEGSDVEVIKGDSRDVVDGDLPGNVECTWMMEDDRVCSHQMALKLDKKALMLEMKRQRLAAAEKEKIGASSSVAVPESALGDKVASLEAKLLGYEEMKTKVAGLEGRVALLGQENTKLKEDKTTAEQSLLEMTSERDSLKTDLDKARLTVKSLEEKYIVDFNQLNSDAAKSYGLGFEQALAQAKHFNPSIDVSGCDPLKEIMKGVLVDLGDDNEEDGSATPENQEEIGDSQGDVDKPNDDVGGVGNEDQGNAPV
ncbi:growth arrest-specific protein 8-like [Sesbania bispinosa]|nr:growth arrest-specific protein 8-like [Sesbania bispinosa]